MRIFENQDAVGANRNMDRLWRAPMLNRINLKVAALLFAGLSIAAALSALIIEYTYGLKNAYVTVSYIFSMIVTSFIMALPVWFLQRHNWPWWRIPYLAYVVVVFSALMAYMPMK